MNCIDARDALLTADIEELAGQSDSELAAHLRECDVCRALADRMTRDLDGLSQLLDERAPTVRRIRRTAFLVGTAAAAVVVGIVLPQVTRSSAPADVPAAHVRSVSVDVRPGQRAAVIATKDPKVTIVWFVQGGGH